MGQERTCECMWCRACVLAIVHQPAKATRISVCVCGVVACISPLHSLRPRIFPPQQRFASLDQRHTTTPTPHTTRSALWRSCARKAAIGRCVFGVGGFPFAVPCRPSLFF